MIHSSKSARQLLIEVISQPLRNTVSLAKTYVWEVIGSNPVGDSDFSFVPCSWHADHFIFTFVSPSLKFTIVHSFTTHCNIDIADPSSMQDVCQIWTQYMALLSMSSPKLKWIERSPSVWEVIGLNPVGDSDFFFVPCSWHADHFIFAFVSPSLKFIIFHSFKSNFHLQWSIYKFPSVSTPQVLIGPSAGPLLRLQWNQLFRQTVKNFSFSKTSQSVLLGKGWI